MVRTLEPYEGFSRYYDFIYEELDYDADVEAILAILSGFGVPECGRILDLGCGTGQHAVRLATRGYEVVGVDASPQMVARARERAEREGVSVEFLVQDMRELDVTGDFDAALCLFGTFSYLVRCEVVDSLLSRLCHTLKSGGAFIFDFFNKGGVVKGWRNWRVWEKEGLTLFRLDRSEYDEGTGVLRGEYVFIAIRSGELEDFFREEHTFRAYDFAQIKEVFKGHGFDVLKFYKPALLAKEPAEKLEEAGEKDFTVRGVAVKSEDRS